MGDLTPAEIDALIEALVFGREPIAVEYQRDVAGLQGIGICDACGCLTPAGHLLAASLKRERDALQWRPIETALNETIEDLRQENDRLKAQVAELENRTGRSYESWPCPCCKRHRVQAPYSYRPEFSTPEDEEELSAFPECEKCHWRPHDE